MLFVFPALFKYRVLKTICAGEGPSSRPTPECSVKMKVKGYLESGKAVEYSHPYKFIVGDGDVIQGTLSCMLDVFPHLAVQLQVTQSVQLLLNPPMCGIRLQSLAPMKSCSDFPLLPACTWHNTQ